MNAIHKLLISIVVSSVLLASMASAHITIDPTDKFLKSNGVKRFMVGTYALCSFSDKSPTPPTEPCADTLAHNPNMDFSLGEYYGSTLTSPGYPFADWFNSKKIYWWGSVASSNVMSKDSASIGHYWRSLEYWGGNMQEDEPDLSSHNISLATLQARYNNAKTVDPNHPVFLNFMGTASTNLEYYKNVADIFSWDKWTKQNTASLPWDTTRDWLYAAEREAERAAVGNVHDVERWDKPVIGFAIAIEGSCTAWKPFSLAETRAYAYWNVAIGTKGVAFYPLKNYMGGCKNSNPYPGYWSNATKYNYINNVLANELHNFPWIFTPSESKSWGRIDGIHINLTGVTFSNNPTKTVTTWGGSSQHKRFNYMLKHINSTHDYIIVLNKDSAATTTNIGITRLVGTGNRVARTIGFEPYGSAKAGRTIPVTDGVFTDTFDGFAAHVYEISSGTTSNPNPTPTCSDSIQNQGETGIDCGGPCSACTTNPTSLSLKPGWNQISSPLAAGIDIATIEAAGCVILPYKNQKLWAWNAQTQTWINPTKVEPFKGYWIYAAYQCTVPLSGTPATFTSLPLTTGWNKISAQGTFSAIRGTCANHITGNWIWNWDKTTEKWIHPATMQLDKGYWIKVDQNCVLGA